MIGLKIGQIEQVSAAFWGFTGSADNMSLMGKNLDGSIPFAAVTNSIATFTSNGVARISVLGLAFVVFFTTLKTPGAVIISIILATLCGINAGLGKTSIGDSSKAMGAVTDLTMANWYNGAIGYWLPDMTAIPSGLLRFDKANMPAFWSATFTFLFVEMFDSFGTISACVTATSRFVPSLSSSAKNNALVNRAMLVDGFGLMLGAIIGSNSITCYIESLTGIEAGARTGFASVVTGSACVVICWLFRQPVISSCRSALTFFRTFPRLTFPRPAASCSVSSSCGRL